MTLPRHAGYVIAPLHLVAGFLFALLPGSPYDKGYYAVYGAILVVLAIAVLASGWIAAVQRPGAGALALQIGAAAMAVAVPFFLVDFSDPWHAILYLPIMAGSLIACFVAALLGPVFGRRP
jgi:hypothetical protein